MTPHNAPVISGMNLTAETVAWARCRPPEMRTPLPRVGELVLYRKDAHGPAAPAEIVAVDMENDQDWNVWRFKLDPNDSKRAPVEDALGRRVMELVDDPWPDVMLKIKDVPGLHVCREARLAGSPGWLRETGVSQ